MASNGHDANCATPISLCDIRMSAFDRAAAQHHIDTGVAIADLMVQTSRRIRRAIAAIGSAFREVVPH